MGTRGFIGFVSNDIERITYNHFDSYPSGVGVDILAEVKRMLEGDLDSLKSLVADLTMVDDTDKITADELAKLDPKWRDGGVSTGDDWYSALRNCQGSLEAYLKAGFMPDSGSFPLDSLFCEWGYLVNLDDGTFEVYRGFNKALPAAGRWANRPTREEQLQGFEDHKAYAKEQGREPWLEEEYFTGDDTYKAVSLLAVWPLHKLPDDDTFLAETEKLVYGEDDG